MSIAAAQVEAVATLVNGVGESVLYTCLEAEAKRNGQETEEDRMRNVRNVATRLVPATVPGSPAYHRIALQSLLAIVAKRGMPSFFVTLTADEASLLAWKEIKELERLANHIIGDDYDSDDEDDPPLLNWKDLPVECARLFHDRVQNFLHQHLLREDDPLLGRIEHHTVRYESQASTSPQAMLLECMNSLNMLPHHRAGSQAIGTSTLVTATTSACAG